MYSSASGHQFSLCPSGARRTPIAPRTRVGSIRYKRRPRHVNGSFEVSAIEQTPFRVLLRPSRVYLPACELSRNQNQSDKWHHRHSLDSVSARLILVPGLAQHAGVWHGVIGNLAHDVEAEPVEIPRSTTFDAAVAEIADCGPAAYAGYSLGGRLCLAAALLPDSPVERLVLISATAGVQIGYERRTRRRADDALAVHAENHGADSFYRRFFANPTFTEPDRRRSLEYRYQDPSLIAHQLRTLGQGSQPNLWPRLAELSVPVLIIAGSGDAKYAAISGALAEKIGENAVCTLVPDAGHGLIETHPAEVAVLMNGFIQTR